MQREAWPEVRIGDLGEVFTGRTPSTSHPAYFGDDYPFITPGDMHHGKYARATERRISLEGAALLKRIKIPANSICVSCIGWQMGEVIMTAQPSFTNQQINTIVPNGKVEPSFLYYSLRPRKQELLSLGSAAGVRTPILNKSAFCNLKVKIPSLSVQRWIAGILSVYDDLIENNTRRIKILEQMAQMLYREWFGNFRFPGQQKVRMVKSERGLIPAGWEAAKLSALTSLERDGISPSHFESETFWHFSIPAFDQLHMPVRDLGSTIKSNKFLITSGCILISKLNPRLRRIWIPDIQGSLRAIASTEFLVLKLRKPDSLPFVWQLLNCDDFQGQFVGLALGTSTSHQRVKPEDFLNLPILVPASELIGRFCVLVKPVVEEIALLRRKTSILRSTRDLLLPKLVSGEISVEEIESEAAAQTV